MTIITYIGVGLLCLWWACLCFAAGYVLAMGVDFIEKYEKLMQEYSRAPFLTLGLDPSREKDRP